MTYGDKDLSKGLLPHNTKLLTDGDLASVKSSDIHLSVVSQEILQPPITESSLKITY